jgi:hypothetical protein
MVHGGNISPGNWPGQIKFLNASITWSANILKSFKDMGLKLNLLFNILQLAFVLHSIQKIII